MSRMVLNEAAVEALKKCIDPVVIEDSNGVVIGYFEPPERIYEEGEIPAVSEMELDRRMREGKGIPFAEVRKMLEELS